MAVFDVSLHAPNGNTVTRPIVAENADDAMALMAAEHDVAEYDPAVTIVAKQRQDEGGRLEQLLNDAEARRLDAEFYRFPSVRRRR